MDNNDFKQLSLEIRIFASYYNKWVDEITIIQAIDRIMSICTPYSSTESKDTNIFSLIFQICKFILLNDWCRTSNGSLCIRQIGSALNTLIHFTNDQGYIRTETIDVHNYTSVCKAMLSICNILDGAIDYIPYIVKDDIGLCTLYVLKNLREKEGQ